MTIQRFLGHILLGFILFMPGLVNILLCLVWMEPEMANLLFRMGFWPTLLLSVLMVVMGLHLFRKAMMSVPQV